MKKLLITFLVVIFVLGASFFWWQRGLSPVDKKNKETKIFVVYKGEGIRSIAKRLKDEKLINDQIVFFILIQKLGLAGKIEAGDFRLSPSMDAQSLALELTHGTLDVWITIPEGLRSEEISQILQGKVPSSKNEWTPELKKNEGYLFPDTYLIPKDADINLVIKIMHDNFEKKWGELKSDKNIREVVTLASIVEREAKFREDRPLVAGILTNRLKLEMPLQADATVQYARGKVDSNWWKRPTREDLKINSPFNTYLYTGLPPSPISNPGLEALKAAVNPAKTNYLYYLSSEDGRMHYAESLEEHNQNIEKYL